MPFERFLNTFEWWLRNTLQDEKWAEYVNLVASAGPSTSSDTAVPDATMTGHEFMDLMNLSGSV